MGSLMETMKIMEENSFSETEFQNLQKLKKSKNSVNEIYSNKGKIVKDSKTKILKEEKSNREKYQELLNLYPDNRNIYLRQPSPLFNHMGKESKKKSIEKEKFRERDSIANEPFSENMKKLISKKKK